jgi:hypothetical protein
MFSFLELSGAVVRWMQMHVHCLPLWGMRLITEVVTPARRVATISRRIVKVAHNVPTFLA